MTDDALDAAAARLREGGLVVYPTETVYGLGADALDPAAIDRVFAVKRRPREKPLSLAVPTVAAIERYARLGDRERGFVEAFLPGPVTVLLERRDPIPDTLVAGGEKIGVRVPDHDLARSLLERFAPITATSANVSGRGSITRVADLDAEIADAAVVIDGGITPGGASTVVDPATGRIHRRGDDIAAIEAWLADN